MRRLARLPPVIEMILMTGPRVVLLLSLLLFWPGQAFAQRFPAFDAERILAFGDADLDGRLSLDEYREMVRNSPRMRDAAATIEPMFRRLDTDGDGFLSLAEYRKSFPQRPADRPATDAEAAGTAPAPPTP